MLNVGTGVGAKGNRIKKQEYVRALVELQESRNKILRDLILNDGRIDLLVSLAGYRFDDFHETLSTFQVENQKSLQLAPRGWGKTTIGTIFSAALKILRDRNVRILFASETVTQSSNFLSELKAVLTNPNIVEVFGDLKGETWHESAIEVAGRMKRKEKTVTATGVDGSITSGHYDCIYADDLVTLKNSRTEANRIKVKQWFYTTLLPCVTDSGTEFHVLGTRYHPEDLYNDMMKNDPMFKDSTQIIPALVPETEQSNNPDSFDTNFLIAQRESMGRPYFNAQYNQNPAGIQGTVFDDRFFRYVERFPSDLLVYAGVDLAIGRKDENAKFALVVIGVQPRTFNVYVLAYTSGKFSLKQQNEIIERYYATHNWIVVGIEANAFQASKIQSLNTEENTSHIPTRPLFTKEDKLTRAQRLQVRFEMGQIFFHISEKGGELEEQLLNFPNARYKDLLDALDLAVTTALVRKKKRVRTTEPGILGVGKR